MLESRFSELAPDGLIPGKRLFQTLPVVICELCVDELAFADMRQPIRAILFDFDGVLVHTEPLHYRAFADVLAPLGIQLSESDYVSFLMGYDDRSGFEQMLLMHKRTEPTLDELVQAKNRVMLELIRDGSIGRSADVRETVQQLHRHYPLAICSGALRNEIETLLNAMGLRELFDVIVAAEDVQVSKPDPSGYLKAMRLLGEMHGLSLRPGDCLVVEDSPRVITRARSAGFQTLGIASTLDPEALAEADACIGSLNLGELQQALPMMELLK